MYSTSGCTFCYVFATTTELGWVASHEWGHKHPVLPSRERSATSASRSHSLSTR
jgi:hypothetical protein